MYEYKVTSVDRVVDGDTIDITIDVGFGLYKKERVRVAGIDTPESRTRDKKEKQYGLAAKYFLTGLLENCDDLIVRTEKDGKYGRMLGWLVCNDKGMNINQTMIDEGYAWPYDGGKKEKSFEALDAKRKKIGENANYQAPEGSGEFGIGDETK